MFISISGKRAPARACMSYCITLLLLAGVLPLSTHAETPSLPVLLQLAQTRSPHLLEQAANTRAAAADAQQAKAWSNPNLAINAENLGGPTSGGLSQRQDTYMLTQVFEIGGKRAARIETETRKATAATAREKQIRLQYANELAIAYAAAEAMQLREEVADTEITRAQEDLQAAQALVLAGREADLRVVQARASVAAAQASAQFASAATIEALERLSSLVGVSEPFARIDHPFLTSASDATLRAEWTPDHSPQLASAIAESDVVHAQSRIEEKRWLPDVGVSVGMRKFGWSSESAAVIWVTLNVPLFDRNQSGINAAKERAISAAQRVEAARLDTRAQHRVAVAQASAAQRSLHAAEQSETAAAEAYRLARIGYDAGKTSLAELLVTRRALADAKLLTIDAQLARVRAIAILSMAQGRNAFGESQ